ncbi:MAG: hypothetical protein JXR40_11295 [Pontiellaceae bacterium]|nr:hypothetical protein [Pontiellaceae bacterium]
MLSILLFIGFIFLAPVCSAESEGSFVLEKKRLQPAPQKRSIEAVRDAAPDLWVSLAGDQDNLGYCWEENWFHIELQNPNEERWSDQIIEIPFARMDFIDWFLFRGDKLIQQAASGSMRRLAEGAFNTRFPALAVNLPPAEKLDLFVRIQSETVVHAHFRCWDSDAYAEQAQKREASAAWLVGTLTALLLLTYIFIWSFRELGYVWFPFAFTCFGVGVANLAGYWPDVPWMSCHFRVKTLFVLCSYGSAAFLLLHERYFYELNAKRPGLSKWMLFCAVASLLMGTAASLWLPFQTGMRVAHIVVFLTFISIFIVAVAGYKSTASWWLNLLAYLTFFGYIFTHLAFDLGLIALRIRPETAGMIAVSVSLLLFLLAQVLRVRDLHCDYVAALQDSEQERTLRALDQRTMLRDLHDGLGGINATISLMAAYGKRSSDPLVKNDRFGGIERMANYAGAEIRSLMNTLEQPAPRWKDWLSDLREYCEKVLGAARIECKWSCSGIPPEQWTGFAPALSFMRAIKEAVYNAARHASPTQVCIVLTFSEDTLDVTISDDGTGFADSVNPPGKGLANMKKRIQELDGTFSVHSGSQGTTVLLSIKTEEKC